VVGHNLQRKNLRKRAWLLKQPSIPSLSWCLSPFLAFIGMRVLGKRRRERKQVKTKENKKKGHGTKHGMQRK